MIILAKRYQILLTNINSLGDNLALHRTFKIHLWKMSSCKTNGASKVYEYTKSNLYITDAQRDFYEENGYLLFKNLVDHDLLDECKQRFIDICENDAKRSKWIVLAKDTTLKHKGAKGEYLINKMQYFSYDDTLFKYLSYKPMIDITESIIGPNITAVHNMLINKPPDSEAIVSTHPLHQDLYYFPFGPASSVVTAWTAMEHVDEKNGCLFVIPGTHKYGLKEHEYAPGEKKSVYHQVKGNEELTSREKVYLHMEKGDTVFFHSLLYHGSLPNVTKGFRKAISCQFADNNCYFVDVKGTVQEHVIREIQNMSVRQGYPEPYEDYWRLKSRLIKGEPGHFQHKFLEPIAQTRY